MLWHLLIVKQQSMKDKRKNYLNGYHDALVDVLNQMRIKNDYEYYDQNSYANCGEKGIYFSHRFLFWKLFVKEYDFRYSFWNVERLCVIQILNCDYG